MEATAVRFSDEAETCEECKAQKFKRVDLDGWEPATGKITDLGKFEGETIATYHAYHVMLDGGVDEDSGSAWLVGNMICEETESGFVGCSIYETDEEARKAWEDGEAANEEAGDF